MKASPSADVDCVPVEGPRIVIRGARTHNLRNLDIDVPRDKLVVVTGPSGSGKSSLAFDTLFAEGQRRYVQSLSVSARQHLSSLPKPDADLIEGLSPTVAISQHGRARSPRSTVGTVTELHDYLRLLYARVGTVYSHRSGAPMERHSIEDMVEAILALPVGTRLSLLAEVAREAPGDHADLLEQLRRRGFLRVAIDDEVVDLSEPVELDPGKRHTIEVYVDRLKIKEGIRARLADSLELTTGLSEGSVKVLTVDGDELRFSTHYTDFENDVSYPEITPSLFSFNAPAGACPTCGGLGSRDVVDPRRVIGDEGASVAAGALLPLSLRAAASLKKQLPALAELLEFDLDAPWSALTEDAKIAVLEGSGDRVLPTTSAPFEGVLAWVRHRVSELDRSDVGSDDEDPRSVASSLRSFVASEVCPACDGSRLRLEARMVRVGGLDIAALARLSLSELMAWVQRLEFDAATSEVAEVVLEQVRKRLSFLLDIGLHYLTLDRRANTLSGGESQRIRLATQVGASLVGITYILDEPSIGLHQRDNGRLIEALIRLRDLGNSVIVVEHDEDTMRAADWLIDMGPGAGAQGGAVIAAGPLEHILRHPASATGRVLSGAKPRSRAAAGRKAKAKLTVRGARGHNLQGATASFGIGQLNCVTGVSGSGKSSLVIETLLPEAARALNRANGVGLEHDGIDGLRHFDKVIHVDQSPIGRSARSNPATYTGIFTELRNVFAQLPDARVRGYGPARFSFNVKGGRCEVCQGEGLRRIEMHFLSDLFVECKTCRGSRYNKETLAIAMRGKTIADVLAMSVAEAFDFFVAHPAIRSKLEVLRDVGLGYVCLGQSARTLSGGEAQRIKLARELARKSTGSTLFILDEPTTGLHFGDVAALIAVLQRLVDEGNTAIVIEHNLDVIRSADHVVDVGPEGGTGGGNIVVSGPPKKIAAHKQSHTAAALRGT